VEKFHKENPLLPGMAREELRAKAGRRVRPETFRAALEELVARRKIELAGEIVKRAGTEIALQPEEARAKEQIDAAFAAAGLAVPAVKEVLAKLAVDARRAEKLLQILLREQRLVRVTAELVFHRDALGELRERLRNFQKTRGPRITVPVFKELAGISRKYAIPLLEYLDRQGVTRRAGDERVIL
jgi:selenocysteine-specific elongation factor